MILFWVCIWRQYIQNRAFPSFYFLNGGFLVQLRDGGNSIPLVKPDQFYALRSPAQLTDPADRHTDRNSGFAGDHEVFFFSNIQDADATQAILELTQSQTALSAALQSKAKIQSQSLFDYLR